MTLGWDRRAIACASRRRRTRPVTATVMILMAIRLFRSGSYAEYTDPIPPSPMRDSTMYRPRDVPRGIPATAAGASGRVGDWSVDNGKPHLIKSLDIPQPFQ